MDMPCHTILILDREQLKYYWMERTITSYESEKPLKIYSQGVVFKPFTIIICAFSIGIGQDVYRKGIHQIELEHNKIYYLESTYKPVSEPPIPLQKRIKGPSKIVFGYHPYWSGTKWQNYNYDLLTTIAYFSAEANGNGDLTNLHGWPKTDLINKAHENGVEVALVVTLFNKTELETLLSSSDNRNRLINNLVPMLI